MVWTFPGKSTVADLLAQDNNTLKREKLISPIENNIAWQKILEIRKSPVWKSQWNEKQQFEYEKIMHQALKFDIENFRQPNEQIIQDTIFLIKRFAKIIQEDNNNELFQLHKKLIMELHDMNSIYLTATSQERLKRFNIRKNAGQKITATDKILQDNPKEFFELDEIYQNEIQKRFSNTIILDTTNATPNEIIAEIKRSI